MANERRQRPGRTSLAGVCIWSSIGVCKNIILNRAWETLGDHSAGYHGFYFPRVLLLFLVLFLDISVTYRSRP